MLARLAGAWLVALAGLTIPAALFIVVLLACGVGHPFSCALAFPFVLSRAGFDLLSGNPRARWTTWGPSIAFVLFAQWTRLSLLPPYERAGDVLITLVLAPGILAPAIPNILFRNHFRPRTTAAQVEGAF